MSPSQPKAITLDSLLEEHPQINEKSLVDLTNGLDVIDDHIEFSNPDNTGFLTRLWRHVTGESDRRQHAINQHISTSLKSLEGWLLYLEKNSIKSNMGIIKISNKLLETRQALLLIKNSHDKVKQDVDIILGRLSEVDVKCKQLDDRIDRVDAGRLAEQQLSAVFDRWKARRLHAYPILLRVFFVLDELYWGDFGNYIRHHKPNRAEAKRLLYQLQDKALIQFEQDWKDFHGESSVNISWQHVLLQEIQSMEPIRREAMAYLTHENQTDAIKKMPMITYLNQMASGFLDNPKLVECSRYVPRVLTPDNAINHFLLDYESRYESNKI
jgi:hypothetical protein